MQTSPGYPQFPVQPAEPEVDADHPLVITKRERLFTRATWVLVALLIGGGSFALGAHLKKTPAAAAATGAAAQSQTNAQTAGRGTAATNGAAATNAGNAGGGFGGATVGQITKIDGNTIYVQDAQGNTVTVSTTPTTPINVAKAGTLADLTTGETVVVQGTAGTGGAMTATSISAGSAFGARGATAGRGGGAAGQGRAPTTTAASGG